MTRCFTWCRKISLVLASGLLFAGSCAPDNLWAEIWGYTLVDGTTAAVRNTVLNAVGLQLP